MPSDNFLLGIDIGTSSVKVLAVDHDGIVVARSRQGYGIIRPNPGLAEQDPHDWWRAVGAAIKQINTKVDMSRVSAIGLSGQLNGLVFIDEYGEPLGNAPIWLDQRAYQESVYLSKHYGEQITEFGLSAPAPINTLPKILWFINNRPSIVERAHKILFVKDYIAWKLTGHFGTDVSDAGAALMVDLRRRRWATDFLTQVDIPPRLLPDLHESPDVIGTVTSEAAAILGIPQNVPVVAGAGDMAALAVGTGVTTSGSACATIGTAGHVACYMDSFPDKVDERLWLMCHAIPGKYFWHGLVMTGGYSLSWFIDNFRCEKSDLNDAYTQAFEEAAEVSPGSNGLVFLPFLNGAATPLKNPFATAAFIGATSTTTRAEFTRAVLEGVAYNFRDSFELLADLGAVSNQIQVGEGGSRNPLWPQIMADVMGLKVNILAELESSAFGAAIIAGVGTEVWTFAEAGQKAVRRKSQIEPDPTVYHRYTRTYMRYQKLISCLAPVWRDIDEH